MKLVIDEFSSDNRIDSFLADYMQDFSRSKIQTAIKKGKVLVNGTEKKPSYTLKDGDKIEFEDLVEESILKVEPENIPLEVIWEDENMAVINKPSGMLSHPTFIETSGTLVNALLYK